MPAMTVVDSAIECIIKEQEGGYVLSSDPDGGDGGWTFAGITRTTFFAHANSAPTKAAVAALIVNTSSVEYRDFIATIHSIYETQYVPMYFQELPQLLHLPYLSASINCGLTSAVEILQVALNMLPGLHSLVEVDGKLGPLTMSDVAACHEADLRDAFMWAWMKHYVAIVLSKPEKLQFLVGWSNRILHWF